MKINQNLEKNTIYFNTRVIDNAYGEIKLSEFDNTIIKFIEKTNVDSTSVTLELNLPFFENENVVLSIRGFRLATQEETEVEKARLQTVKNQEIAEIKKNYEYWKNKLPSGS